MYVTRQLRGSLTVAPSQAGIHFDLLVKSTIDQVRDFVITRGLCEANQSEAHRQAQALIEQELSNTC
jgi:hypothetical protein